MPLEVKARPVDIYEFKTRSREDEQVAITEIQTQILRYAEKNSFNIKCK